MPSAVIARSDSDEAIHASACCAMDCFACARNDGEKPLAVALRPSGTTGKIPLHPTIVIARSDSDEAIHASVCCDMDCFVAIAPRNDGMERETGIYSRMVVMDSGLAPSGASRNDDGRACACAK